MQQLGTAMRLSSIFRNYDIRGTYPYQVHYDAMYKIGFAFAKHNLSKTNNKILVAYDGRPSSPALCNALISGLQTGGAKTIQLGFTTTPALYYADKLYTPAASFMVTASHNPLKDNGLKIIKDGKSFFGMQLQTLHRQTLYIKDVPPIIPAHSERINIHKQYIKHIINAVPNHISPHIKCIWDAGSGAAAPIIKELIKSLPNHNWAINCNTAYNRHSPDPTSLQRRKILHAAINQYGADLALSFDADADRLCVMQPDGTLLHGDQLLAIFSQDILDTNPGNNRIIADIKTSHILLQNIEQLGAQVTVSKTGHPWIKQQMQQDYAIFAGEYSGHFFFADHYYGYDDGIYAALRLLALVSKYNMTLNKLISKLPKTYCTPEFSITLNHSARQNIISSLRKLVDTTNEHQTIITIDGIKIIYKNGWWLARLSNTTNALIIRCEAISAKGLKEIITLINKYLAQCDIDYEIK